MAEQNVTIFTDKAIGSGLRYLAADISTLIDTTNNVKFVDGNGGDTAINRIMVGSDGTVEARAYGATDSSRYNQYFIKGGWHHVEPIGLIYGVDATTDVNIGIRVRWED